MKKLKVMTVFGTRPEAVKMAPLVLELQKYQEIETIVAVTAQHRQMLDIILETFAIEPQYDLNIMQKQQTLSAITMKAMEGLEDILKKEKPDLVLVHGDTTTTFAASLAAFYQQVAVGHVEAGLRTWNKYSPYPEEMNRQLTGVLADLHFAPTSLSVQNLVQEGKQTESVYVTGNTAIDALTTTIDQTYTHEVLERLGGDRLILVTAHRRENLGEPMRNMFRAIKRLVQENEDVQVIYPVHLNPVVQDLAAEVLGDDPRIHLIDPLALVDFHNFLARAYLILTDSGGVQEEAPSLGVPVLVLRDNTERPEGIRAGTLRLAGTDEENIYRITQELLSNEEAYKAMAQAANPYGDGQASRRIVEAILYHFGYRTDRPDSFQTEE
ncbi:UDP-N-acetylglucosamine 2-epimerase [Fictibacillus macauensis ZFHKF-1]|uniref:UDP-N-acetylglucosamine 2-epimerase (non-hydrolyzing) n=1 Tax=Fictibacillus macauensis ZFHKF-1 TaxID=1196324 RepID=I8J524_9BACL|nr:UDP-N-acetylglucosamine 2-epimerase (non-hydrolyzing) [Fictibacillus macauensis]EIT86906.1 UDP-N-acetylglucosamine 2-epimerase [Fictibacillus macauensis ZFHKF-1]